LSVFDGGFELAVLGGWPVAVVVALITSVLVFRALRTTPRPSPAITALRVATLLVACIVVIQPTWSSERVERTPGELAIIVDASRSMSVRANGRTRYDRAKALLERWSGERRAARAAVYTLDDALRPTSFDGIESGSPDGQSSRIAAALSELAERGASSEIGAVVLVTDGRDTDRALAARSTFEGMRVHVVAVGTDDAIRDDAITEARADARAYLRGKYTVRATLRAPALAGQTVPVTLERDDEPYQSRDVAVDASGNAQVVFELPAERMGLVFLRIAIPVVSEDAVPENNVRSMIVRVVRDRLRVLHVSGRPSWDMRFMRGFLKRDPSIDLVSFFILRTTTDLAQADPSEMSLIPFPTDELFREHLSSFDVVVFQDFEFRPYQIAPYLPAIRHYVRGGGSFVMIGGEGSFSGGGYGLTAIADILPVEVLPGSGDDLLDEARFHPVVPDAMTRHPLVAHGTGDVPTSVAWRSLGEAIGTNVVGAARPGAVTLLEHPTRTVNGARMPVLSVWDIDEGRALALTIDTSWRWGMPTGAETGDGSFFTRFWDRAFRWLARDPSLEPSRIELANERVGPRARVRASVLARDGAYAPRAGARITLTIEALDGAVVTRGESTADQEGVARFVLDGPRAVGAYRLRARIDEVVIAEEAIVVETSGTELADVSADARTLEAVAMATRGRYVARPEDAPRLADFDGTRERSLGITAYAPFRSPFVAAALIALFALEWWLRRRAGLR
jgi:uncharacterized membrane protein